MGVRYGILPYRTPLFFFLFLIENEHFYIMIVVKRLHAMVSGNVVRRGVV